MPAASCKWERTIASILSEAGYATSIYGKWHIGAEDGRFPTDHGFDEWYGPLRTYDECMWLTTRITCRSATASRTCTRASRARAAWPLKDEQLTMETKKTCDLEYQKRAHQVHGEVPSRRTSRSTATSTTR